MYLVSGNRKFFCKHCEKKSKLPKITPEYRTFKIICHHCGKATFLSFNKKNKYILKKPPKKERKTPLHREKKPFFSLSFVYLTILCSVLLLSSLYFFDVLEIKMINFDKKISVLKKNRSIKIFDKHNLLISEIYKKRTSELTWQEYPQRLKDFVVYVEDKNFYSHIGFDIIAIIRSFLINIMSNDYRQGGSTISQQLSRIILNNREKTLKRKWEELKIAILLELKLTKEEILLHYLNNVYLGHGAFGFNMGAKFYFNKKIDELNIKEILILISLISSPNYSSPIKNIKNSIKKVEQVVNLLLERGIISKKEVEGIFNIYEQFKFRSPLETVYGMRIEKAPYITEHIRNVLPRILPEIDDVYKQGGYNIKTTISLPMQLKIEKVLNQYLNTIQRTRLIKPIRYKKPKYNWKEFLEPFTFIHPQVHKKRLEVAAICINSRTGKIIFMQGGTNFSLNNQFNRTYQMYRQTGSTIKPIIYSAAIDLKIITPNTILSDYPVAYKVKRLGFWLPKNVSNYYEGKISVRDAFRKSKNTIAVQITDRLGKRNLDRYFTKFFFPERTVKLKRFRNDLSIALGSLELSPLEISLAFSAFTNKGYINRPYLISSITNINGETVYSYQKDRKDEFNLKIPYKRKVISLYTTKVVSKMMKLSARYSLNKYGYDYRIAGKTGTTNDNKDVWFVGTAPYISMALWIGYDNLKSLGNRALAARVAAPIWLKVFRLLDRENLIR